MKFEHFILSYSSYKWEIIYIINGCPLTIYIFSGLPYAAKHADYYADDYNYSSDDYPSGDGDENFIPETSEKVIHVTPVMQSKDSDKFTNEGDLIKLPCVVDNLGMIKFCYLDNTIFISCIVLLSWYKLYK